MDAMKAVGLGIPSEAPGYLIQDVAKLANFSACRLVNWNTRFNPVDPEM